MKLALKYYIRFRQPFITCFYLSIGLKKNGYLTAYHRLSLLYNSLTTSDIEGWSERRETMGEFLNAEKRLQYQSQMKDSIDTAMVSFNYI